MEKINGKNMETIHLLEELSSKLTLVHEDLREIIAISNQQSLNISRIPELVNEKLSNFTLNLEKGKDPFVIENIPINSTKNVYAERKPIIQTWRRLLNQRKQNFWNFIKFQNTSVIYETWLGKDNPVLPRKFLPKFIPGEHDDDRNIRRENALRNFEVEIRLMKNKSSRYETKYLNFDDEMSNIIVSNISPDMTEAVLNLWKSECENEEQKSVKIWERKQIWLERYESEYGTNSCANNDRKSRASQRVRKNANCSRNSRTSKPEVYSNSENPVSKPPQRSDQKRIFKQRKNNVSQRQRSNNRESRNQNLNFPPDNSAGKTNVVHQNGITYIGKNVSNHFLDQRGCDKGGGTLQAPRETEHQLQRIHDVPEMEDTNPKELL